MARKRRAEEHENHERWLVSYADFITLLFAFFVVMYSISSVNEGKYRVLSDSIVAAFHDPNRSMEPIQIGDLTRSVSDSESVLDGSQSMIDLFQIVSPDDDALRQAMDTRDDPSQSPLQLPDTAGPTREDSELADSIQAAMSGLVDAGLIDIRRDKRWIEVEIKSSILFPSGSATLSSQARPVLRELADRLRTVDNVIHVEGFTDNVPINNLDFYSNWELSAARAASVVHLFTGLGIDPSRLAAIGYGEFRPVASNATAEGRARNRRVVVVIMSGKDARVSAPADHLQSWRERPGAVSAGVEP